MSALSLDEFASAEAQADIKRLTAELKLARSRVAAMESEAHAQAKLLDYATTAIRALPAMPPAPRPRKPGKGQTVESAVMVASCWHVGETVRAAEMGGLNEYNFDVFCLRLQRLVDAAVRFTTENMRAHVFDELHVIHTGDFVSGIIHDELSETNCLNIVEQATLGALVTAQALRELAAVFPRVVFTGVVGNHGRTTPRKRAKGKQQINWDYVAYQYLALMLRDQRNVRFNLPLSFWAGIEIKGHNFHVSHGDDIKSWAGIPFYGLGRSAAKWLEIGVAKRDFFRYFVRSHFHTRGELQTALGENILNGSMKGGDEYALTLPAFGDPIQLLFGVHERYGKTWSLPINTKFTDTQCRYYYDRDRPLAERPERKG